jgi:hypothetical protein
MLTNEPSPLIDATKSNFSKMLLDHDGLMTPVLIAQFGTVTVRQNEFHQDSDRLLRKSSIYQAASGSKILDAALEISLPALPPEFLGQLLHQDKLFGQLLNDFSIPIRITARTLHHASAEDNGGIRWGRRLTMYRDDTQEFVSHVEELMMPDHELLTLRLGF